ncbi:HbrB-domain-containing protein [Fomitiporia mediterranea MF3/22]|uniref:HbrB-domain-containing protein n=1 Tax=Fomitiporia mediterranea (strain MF3/22) TaxID=694068 RepID=UPI0004407BBC|nr:HbrB-domain-containing protein [Fomitiporia mediterranea MF3/22]EJD03276.1 HbrB-domain-containing protein [Fomitiporia mediterranea MF3/22]
MASPPSSSKMHASPSKGPTPSAALTSANRTYDAKLVQREMLRLGTLAGQLPAAAFNTIAGTTAAALNSASTLVLPSGGVAPPGAAGSTHGHGHTLGHALGHGHGGTSNMGIAMGGSDAWAQLHVHVLPLFNHEQLQFPIEDLNLLVRRHIEAVTSAGPARALSTLEVDIAELIGAGMTTLNTKLSGVDDDKLPARVVELWTFFWDQVLPYVEGVFIPLQTHPLLLALHRTPKSHRPASPTTLTSPDDPSSGAPSTTLSPIDVRTIALRAFRDKIIVPVASRLETRLIAMRPGSSFSSSTSTSVTVPGTNMNNSTAETTTYQHPRLQQMLLVLHSQAQRSRVALSINCPTPQLSPQELVIRRLLDALQSHRAALSGTGSSLNGKSGGPLSPPRHRRAPSFLSGGAPRDRRGRVGIGLNAGADSDKENAKRRGRYIDDATYPTPGPSGSVNTASSSYTIGENSSGINKHRFGRYVTSDWDEDAEWEMGHKGTPGSGSWDGSGTGGGTTPRGRFSAERERDRTFLESLRSPNPVDHDQPSSFTSFVQIENGSGLNGLNGGANVAPVVPGRREDSLPVPRPTARDDVFSSAPQTHTVNGNGHGHTNSGDNHLDWDSAQAVVERMIGLNAGARSESPSHAHGHLHSHTPSPAPALPGPAPPPPSAGPPSLVHTQGPGQGPGPPQADSRRRRMT